MVLSLISTLLGLPITNNHHLAPDSLVAAAVATVKAVPTRIISPWLASMSMVYSWAPDKLYVGNDTIVSWGVKTGVRTARYPAGQNSYWNWEQPSGLMGVSSYAPGFDAATASDPSLWTSLSEYLDVCERANLKPLIGVNYNCHGSHYVNSTASIASAVRQVEYVVGRGFTGAFWYVGNEDMVTADDHTALWREHVLAMKRVDPTMKVVINLSRETNHPLPDNPLECPPDAHLRSQVFFNFNGIRDKSLRKMLRKAGDVIDGAEFHGKWPYGGRPKCDNGTDFRPYTHEEWLSEVPLIEHKSETTWRARIDELRAAATAMGRSDLLIANNEFGLGKWQALQGFNRYTKALVNVEFGMEMYVGGYDMAVFWDNSAHGRDEQKLMTPAEGYRFNPSVYGFSWLNGAAGKQFVEVTTSNPRIHGFAAMAAEGDAPSIQLFLINKMEEAQAVTIRLGGHPALVAAAAMVDTSDHWGTTQALPVSSSDGAATVTLPAESFAVLSSEASAVFEAAVATALEAAGKRHEVLSEAHYRSSQRLEAAAKMEASKKGTKLHEGNDDDTNDVDTDDDGELTVAGKPAAEAVGDSTEADEDRWAYGEKTAQPEVAWLKACPSSAKASGEPSSALCGECAVGMGGPGKLCAGGEAVFLLKAEQCFACASCADSSLGDFCTRYFDYDAKNGQKEGHYYEDKEHYYEGVDGYVAGEHVLVDGENVQLNGCYLHEGSDDASHSRFTKLDGRIVLMPHRSGQGWKFCAAEAGTVATCTDAALLGYAPNNPHNGFPHAGMISLEERTGHKGKSALSYTEACHVEEQRALTV